MWNRREDKFKYTYDKWKGTIKEEEDLYNSPSSEIIFRARTSNIQLGDRNRHKGKETCIMCDSETENTTHFMLWCPEYEKKRRAGRNCQNLYIENEDTIFGDAFWK